METFLHIAALRQNMPFRIKGRVVDEEGRPVDGVTMRIHTARAVGVRPATGPSPFTDVVVGDDEQRTIDGALEISRPSAKAVFLTLEKEGHYTRRLAFGPDDTRATSVVRDDLVVAFPRRGRPTTLADYLAERPQHARTALLVDLAGPPNPARCVTTAAPAADTARGPALICELQPGPDGTPLLNPINTEVGTPAPVRLRFSVPDGGFVRAEIRDDRAVGLEMMRAPADGYAPELGIEPPLGGRPVYFYFRCADKYGRGKVGRVLGLVRDKTVSVDVELRVQPDGTRNLETGEAEF